MTTADIDQALRVLNIEPLYGHSPYNPTVFRRALPFPQIPAAGPVYFPEDEEIDFDRVLREEKIALPKGVSWIAHWLAVEGVQPLIPENPPAIPRETDGDPNAKGDILKVNGTSPMVNGAGLPLGPTGNLPAGVKKPSISQQASQNSNQQIVKQVLSRELQLYYARLTSSLLPPSSDFAKRAAALASLRNDAGLQSLLPYLVRWVAEGVVASLKEESASESDGKVLEVLLDVISAILDNSTLFVEPYVSQFILQAIIDLYISSVTSNTSSHPFHSFTFFTPSEPCNSIEDECVSNSIQTLDATLNNIPFSVTAHHEDLTTGTYIARQKPWDTRRCHSWSCRCWKGGCTEGVGRRRRC